MGFTHRYDIAPFQGWLECEVVLLDGLHPSLGYCSMGFTHRYDIAPFQGWLECEVVWVDGLHPSLGYYALSGLRIASF
jgi:hypothetical protein